MRSPRMIAAITFCLVAFATTAYSGAPSTFSYQGRLTNSAGVAVPDGPYAVTFSLWTDPVAGSQVWTENQDIISSKGLFSTELGKIDSFFDVFADYSDIGLCLQIQVNIGGSIETITPRTPISSVPYSQGTRRVVDDTVSTGGLAIFAGVAIPRFISITNDATKSSISIDEPGVHRCVLGTEDGVDGTSSILDVVRKGSGTRAGGIRMNENQGRFFIHHDDDDDGVGEVGVEASAMLPRSVLKSYFQSGDTPTQTQITDSVDESGAHNKMTADLDGDGLAESSVSSSARTSGASLAIKTKGTSAQRLQAGGDCDDTDAEIYASSDNDGDGVAENSVSSSARSSGASLAIKTKGTSAQRLQAGGDCDDTDAQIYASSDNDDDGIQEAKVTIQARDAFGNPGSSLYLDCDSDDDGVSERQFTVDAQGPIITSRMSFFDVFADLTIIDSIDATGARHFFGHSQGATHGGLRMATYPNLSSFSISETGVQMAITVGDNGSGTNTGEIGLSAYGSENVSLTSDGNAYFSSSVGINVPTPVHPVEHSSGAHLAVGGTWNNASDANLKENFQEVNGEEILERIETLPISQWNYKAESVNVTHIGPTAQDFKEVFGVGGSDKTISTIDPSGIALAAIKQLKKENNNLRKEIDELKRLVEDLASKKN